MSEVASVAIALGSAVVGAGVVGAVALVKHLSTAKIHLDPGADTTDVENVQPDPDDGESDQPKNDEMPTNGPPNTHFQMSETDK